MNKTRAFEDESILKQLEENNSKIKELLQRAASKPKLQIPNTQTIAAQTSKISQDLRQETKEKETRIDEESKHEYEENDLELKRLFQQREELRIASLNEKENQLTVNVDQVVTALDKVPNLSRNPTDLVE